MIHLLQPPPRDRISGGFTYNAEIGRRLAATGLGSLLEVEESALGAGPPAEAEGATLVVDSLYLAGQDPPAWLTAEDRAFATRLLLHYLPSANPTLSAAERAPLEAREQAWIDAVDAVVTTSERLAAEVEARHGCPAHPSMPGVSAFFRPDPAGTPEDARDAFTVLMVGALVPEKGQLDVARALAGHAGQGTALRLVLVGDTGAAPEYAAELRDAAPAVEVVQTGCLSPQRVAEQMRAAQVFVSASNFESYGMAVSEAVATRLPVVSYRVGEVERWVRDGENGHLLAVGDTAGLARVLGRLIERPADLDTLREPRTQQFFPSWEYSFERFLSACRSATGEAPLSEEEEPVLYSRCDLPTAFGTLDLCVYRLPDDEEAILIRLGDLDTPEPPFVRVHSECFTGEILHSLKCDCKLQLEGALQAIAERGHGAVVYLRQEGRGIGLGNKVRAYAEQAKGADTIEANERLGFPADLRDFRAAAAILRANGARRVHLNTNNPNKVTSLEANGIVVERVIPSTTDPNPHNLEYLLTKYRSLGHAGLQDALHGAGLIPDGDPAQPAAAAPDESDRTLVLMDLDGVIQVGDTVPREAIDMLAELRAGDYVIRFLTNDGINSRASRLEQLRRCGLDVELDELYTASYLTARYLAERGLAPILPLCGRPALDEFEGLEQSLERPRAVVVGDYFPHYDYDAVKAAYTALAHGAELIAMHKKRSWPTGGARVIDIGFWVAGLEFCSRRPATVIGKPAEYSYATVLRDTGFQPERVVMVSDEVEPDLIGARRWGIRTVHFGHLADADETPPDGRTLAPTYGDVWKALQAHTTGA
jgi:HAD superfamily hydrolase (TIGR01458 family)